VLRSNYTSTTLKLRIAILMAQHHLSLNLFVEADAALPSLSYKSLVEARTVPISSKLFKVIRGCPRFPIKFSESEDCPDFLQTFLR